jgi:hypothetical protein
MKKSQSFPIRRLRDLRRRSRRYLEVEFPKIALRLNNFSDSSMFDALGSVVAERQIEWSNVEKIFIHVPKCGGTSINKLLASNHFEIVMSLSQLQRLVLEGDARGPRLLSLDHLNTDILISLGLLNRALLERVEAFSVVRNPYSRLLSAYDFHKRRGFVNDKLTLSDYLAKLERGDWGTDRRNVFGLSHALPSSYFLRPQLWDGPQQIMQLEDQSALNHYLSRVVGQKVSLEHLNAGNRGQRRWLADSEVEFVNRCYHEDFLLGGYEKRSGSAHG